MTFNYKQNALRKIMEKKRMEKAKIKEWAENEADDLIKIVKEKRKSDITGEQLPF